MLIKGFFAIHVYDFLKKVHLYILIQDYMAIRDLRVYSLRRRIARRQIDKFQANNTRVRQLKLE